jgi:hypothetical protein
MSKVMLALVVAAATNCPLVNVAGNYTFDLRTVTATVWNDDPHHGCVSKGYVGPNSGGITSVHISPDGLMTADMLWLVYANGVGTTGGGQFGGRVEAGSEPMQWVGSAGDTEFKGTWRKGQLSGEFTRRFVWQGQQIECRGTVSGFKKGK